MRLARSCTDLARAATLGDAPAIIESSFSSIQFIPLILRLISCVRGAVANAAISWTYPLETHMMNEIVVPKSGSQA